MPEPTFAIGTLKLLRTVLSLGLGPLFEPWQKKRIGIADAHNHMRLKLADAQADKLIEDIRAGRKIYDPDSGKVVDLPGEESLGGLAVPTQISNNPAGLLMRSRALRDADDLRRFQNTAAAIEHAAADMEENKNEKVSDAPIDEDWFTKWRRGAEEVSRSDMQQLWGKLLAKEVRTPGLFHLRTLELLRSLSPDDASLISKAMSYVFNGKFVLKDYECLAKNGLSFTNLIDLEDMGVLGSIEAVGGREFSWRLPDTGSAGLFFPDKLGLLVIGGGEDRVVKIPILTLTRVGRDLYNLGQVTDPPMDYIQTIADKIKSEERKIQLAMRSAAVNGVINLVGLKDL